MKLFVQFDASASSYDIRNELSAAASWPGVAAIELLEKAAGDVPRWCAALEVADDRLDEVRSRARGLASQYAGYAFNVKELAYRRV